MRLVEPSYEILDCPDGEACLAKLERICRVAYKSEDKIDLGKPCLLVACNNDPACPDCHGTGWVREPSSHKLIRSILKADRRKQLVCEVAHLLANDYSCAPMAGGEEQLARDVVNLVLDDLRDDPPHESVIEHASITVLFASNRGFTHELVRHRLAAFTQESTRYCNYSKGKFGGAITLTKRNQDVDTEDQIDNWMAAMGEAQRYYLELVKSGLAPQLARDVLPQALKADIVITANLREWRHIFRLRCSPRAHPDMRRLMIPLRDELRRRIPIIFDE